MNSTPRISKVQISILMLLHGYAIGSYLIPLPLVLEANGLGSLRSLPFIFSSVATFISPLIFGSLADRRFAPERLLAVVTFGASLLLTLCYLCIDFGWGPWAYKICSASYHLWASPGWGLLNTIGLMHLANPEKEFGPIRVFATIGFMAGGFLISKAFHADNSAFSGYLAAGIFMVESLYLLTLPPSRPPESARAKSWRDVLGWDAFSLLKHPDHRVIFLVSALFNLPLCAFYIYSPLQLKDMGDTQVSATMSAAQVTEVISLFGLAAVMGRFRLKWLMAAGLALGALRYGLYTFNSYPFMLTGIALHGLIFTFFFMTTQLYIEQRIDNRMRNQAQALLTLMTNGVGALSGYLLFDVWYRANTSKQTDWASFWTMPAIFIALLLVVFLWGYRRHPQTETTAARAAPE